LFLPELTCKSFLGILPEINRVYITIDNRLFLWNYRDGFVSRSSSSTFNLWRVFVFPNRVCSSYYVFDELGQIIVSVGLVKPKPGVFVEDIVYLLVIATPTEIIFLGVRFDGDSVYGDIELVPSTRFQFAVVIIAQN
jgi:nuclear pore complex protein Nup155